MEWGKDPHNEEMRLDVYSPPYLFKGPRPMIGNVSTEWKYGQIIAIASPQAGNIRWASLIKNGVTTHSFDSGQRLVDLDILSQGNGLISAKVTNEPNVAPPGWYMLFLIAMNGVPSISKWVHLTQN